MKKTMLSAAVMAATVAMAIESQNVVGYTAQQTPANTFMLCSTPFEAVGGEGVDLNKVYSGISAVDIDWELEEYTEFCNRAPQMQIWNGTGYDFAYYVSNAWFDNGTEDGAFAEGWCDGSGMLYVGANSYVVTPGYSFWVRYTLDDEKNLLASGQVKSEASTSVECTEPSRFMLLGNPYAVATKLNDDKVLTVSGLTAVDIDWELEEYTEFCNRAPQMQIWNGTGYDFAYFVSNAWYDNGTEDGAFAQGWCDGSGMLLVGDAEYSIGMGYGFWVKPITSACTFTFKSPIK